MTDGTAASLGSASSILAEAAMELLHCESTSDVFDVVARFMPRFAPGSIIVVNELTPDAQWLVTRQIVGLEESMKASIADVIGFEAIGKKSAVSPTLHDKLLGGKLERVLGGLAELASSEIPRSAGGAIAGAFGIGDVYTIGISDGTTAVGNIHILTRDPHATLPALEIESFARHCYSAFVRLADRQELVDRDASNRALLATMTEGLSLQQIILDSDGMPCDARFIDVNPAFESMMGLHADEILGRTLHEVMPSLSDAWIESYGRVALTGETAHLPQYTTTAGRLLETVAYSPGPGKFATLVSDVTDRVHAEVELRENERWLSQSQRVAELGHYLYDIVNDRWESSPSLDEVLGIDESLYRDFAGWLHIVHPDERDRLAAYFAEEVIGKRKPFDIEYRILRPCDGVERWVHGLGKVEWSEDGTPLVMFGVIQDITRRHEAEAQHRDIIQTAMDGFYLTDMEGRLLEVNRAYSEMTGYTEAELLSMCITDLEADESPEQIARRSATILARGEDRFEARHRRKDGGLIEVEVQVRHQQTIPPKLASFLRDITDRKASEAALIENESRLTELLGERERNLELLEGALSSLVDVVSRVVEIRDPYTAGHQQRVAELTVAIAEEMGFAGDEIEQMRLAALIHDVGKMSVPAEILSKPGRLAEVEFELIKGHSESGYQIIASAKMSEDIAQMVYQHHERCDGSGYPRGLTVGELLPGSLVIAVADVVEAMTSHRPYRASLGQEAALAEVERGAGTLYDEDAVRACIACFHVRGFAFSPT